MGVGVNTLFAYLFGLIILYVIGRVLIFPVKILIKLIVNGVLGGAILWLLNIFGSSFGINIGINVVTALIAGLLGIPGVILLLILNYLK
ncbi:MAG: pro-sigmaK processing inhibitor BofA family protein [Ignavibacteriales bacterium]